MVKREPRKRRIIAVNRVRFLHISPRFHPGGGESWKQQKINKYKEEREFTNHISLIHPYPRAMPARVYTRGGGEKVKPGFSTNIPRSLRSWRLCWAMAEHFEPIARNR